MLVKCSGIVLNNTKYSENSVICNIYTKEYGKLGFMVNGVRNNKGAIKNSHLQSLNILDLVIYYNANKSLQKIKELKVSPILHSLHQDPIKIMVTCLITETLVKSIKEEEENQRLYDFLQAIILFLEHADKKELSSFPSFFLLKLASHLGHEIDFGSSQLNTVLDSNTGHLLPGSTKSSSTNVQEADTNIIKYILTQKYEQIHSQNWDKSTRTRVLNHVVHYFQNVVLDGGVIKSLHILKQVVR